MSPNRKPKAQEEQGLIYIQEVARLTHRRIATIRMWQRTGKLPKRLHPTRGHRGWRCWTHEQIHGDKGLLTWMKENDMRPGRLVADPSKEVQHVDHLRKPKHLNGHNINSAKRMAENGRSLEYILEALLPRTKYSSLKNLEKALRKVAKSDGWTLPKSTTPQR